MSVNPYVLSLIFGVLRFERRLEVAFDDSATKQLADLSEFYLKIESSASLKSDRIKALESLQKTAEMQLRSLVEHCENEDEVTKEDALAIYCKNSRNIHFFSMFLLLSSDLESTYFEICERALGVLKCDEKVSGNLKGQIYFTNIAKRSVELEMRLKISKARAKNSGETVNDFVAKLGFRAEN